MGATLVHLVWKGVLMKFVTNVTTDERGTRKTLIGDWHLFSGLDYANKTLLPIVKVSVSGMVCPYLCMAV